MGKSQKDAGCQAPAVGRSRRLEKGGTQPGFTLVELLVVIGIIGVLASLLLPALSHSKSRAKAMFCMHNNQQLSLAWSMYSGDNDERLAYNLGADPTTHMLPPKSSPNWVNNIMDWETNPDNTNLNFVNQSLLGTYVSYSPDIFHCPADRALSDAQRRAGWTGRVRSISMNAMVGDPGPALKGGVNNNNPDYRQFLRESDLTDPSSVFVFLDEHPDSINDGYFLIRDDPQPQWLDLPASYHNGGGSFSFADGHTVIHRWTQDSTLCAPLPYAAGLPISLRANDLADFNWVLRHASVERN